MRYIADSIISFSIVLNGKDKRVSFSPLMGNGSVYITENVDEIKVLESTGTFKRNVFRRAPGYENIKVEEKKKTEGQASSGKKATEGTKEKNAKIEMVESVTSIQEAAEYLSDKFGLNMEDLADPDTIIAKAAENKVEFPNLK